MRPRITRALIAAVAAAAVAVTAFAASAAAVPPLRCEIMSFQMGPQPADASNRPNGIVAEWMAMGSTTTACPDQAVMGLDVWEHAIVAFPADGGHLRGRAQGFMISNGELVNWGGQVRGTADCDAAGVCQLDMRVRGRFENGSRLFLDQQAVLDTANQILIDFTSAGFYEPWPAG
jgi:hypothetical protein